jgi:hypothetical protein
MVREKPVDFANVKGAGRDDGGVAQGRLLVAYTDAVMDGDPAVVARSRAALESAIGPAGVADTAGVIAAFNVVDRIADATGIPVDAATRDLRTGIGAELGMEHRTPEARSR